VCVSRPAGADSPDEPSLHEWLVGTHPSVMTAAGTTRVCHNLDYATSGVVACAKSEGAAREVGRLFEARKARMLRRLCRISAASRTARPYLSGQARKLYAALVFGHPAWEERNISARIAVTARKFRQSVTKASSGKARQCTGWTREGQAAHTKAQPRARIAR
jgi:23S rRNA-/tRNA-specific pseudouridylate synthase